MSLTQEQKDFRKEVARLNSMANKRIKRLAESEFNTSPAYQKWVKDGAEKFSIRGKTQREVRNEYYRVKNYLESSTSSITGTKKTLKNLAENTGMKYDSVSEIHDNATQFFELANKVEEYLNLTNQSAQAIGYQRIWQAINTYVKDNNIALTTTNVDGLIKQVAELSEQKLLQDNRNSYDTFFNTDWNNLE